MANRIDDLLSTIKGPVIDNKPVYDLRSCLECLTDTELLWMMEAYNLSDNSNGADRQSLISSLLSSITNPEAIGTILTAEEMIPGGSPFMLGTVEAMRLADGLWVNTSSDVVLDSRDGGESQENQENQENQEAQLQSLKRELRDLEMAAQTYYPQYEGQFKTDDEYEADKNKHYAEIDRKIAECKTKLREYMTKAGKLENGNEWLGWPTSLVLNSIPDQHLTFLQQTGLVYIFKLWDGKGREAGYRSSLDTVVNWSDVAKRDRDDLNSIPYNLGRVVFARGLFGGGEVMIGCQPFKARTRMVDGEKVWTTQAPRGRESKIEDDVCLRLVVPVEVQKVVWERFLESLKRQ